MDRIIDGTLRGGSGPMGQYTRDHRDKSLTAISRALDHRDQYNG